MIDIDVNVYVNMYVCVCVCLCMCARVIMSARRNATVYLKTIAPRSKRRLSH